MLGKHDGDEDRFLFGGDCGGKAFLPGYKWAVMNGLHNTAELPKEVGAKCVVVCDKPDLLSRNKRGIHV